MAFTKVARDLPFEADLTVNAVTEGNVGCCCFLMQIGYKLHILRGLGSLRILKQPVLDAADAVAISRRVAGTVHETDLRLEAISMVSATTTADKRTPSARWIKIDAVEFQEKFDRTSFAVQHELANHPLFQLPALMELAERTRTQRPDDIYYNNGDIGVDQKWIYNPEHPFSPAETIHRIEECSAWFIFRSAQRDPEYRVFLDKGLAEIKELMGDRLERKIMVEDIIIFVTSPNRKTPYHIDRECNFLLQIRGDKTIHVFDQNDREVLSEEELERFWSVDSSSAGYKAESQSRAKSYVMKPGTGLHIPVNAPHWLENHANVSISLSVNFQFEDSIRANAYRANFLLRRLGIKPTPPGRSEWLDSVKSVAVAPAVWATKKYKKARKHD